MEKCKLIQAIAERGNCVIVGRGADYILSGEKNRIRRELEIKDHSRGMLYQFFTGREWGRVSNYNLSVDTSIFTKTQAMELILSAIEKYNGGNNNA